MTSMRNHGFVKSRLTPCFVLALALLAANTNSIHAFFNPFPPLKSETSSTTSTTTTSFSSGGGSALTQEEMQNMQPLTSLTQEQMKLFNIDSIPTGSNVQFYVSDTITSKSMPPITFRYSSVDWDGQWSDAEQIGVVGMANGKTHAELTSRPVNDGETFSITGNKNEIGAGLCVDSEGLESNFVMRGNVNCVYFLGNDNFMRQVDRFGSEVTTVMDRSPSYIQGFTYNAENNCVTHVGSTSKTCTPLPVDMAGKPLRAAGQVWNGAAAKLSDSSVELRSYADSRSSVANYDYSNYIRFGQYEFHLSEYTTGEVQETTNIQTVKNVDYGTQTFSGESMPPITFRYSSVDWDGQWSDAEQIGVDSADYNKQHTELTSRPVNDGETFSITGSKQQIGVGLCIDSEGLESNYGLRWNYNCVGFYGDDNIMRLADENGKEITLATDRSPSNVQGFKYNARNNCVLHVASASRNCTPLPAHFGGKPVRAVGQVWNGAAAKLSGSSVALRSFVSSGSSEPAYDYSKYIRYGMYKTYGGEKQTHEMINGQQTTYQTIGGQQMNYKTNEGGDNNGKITYQYTTKGQQQIDGETKYQTIDGQQMTYQTIGEGAGGEKVTYHYTTEGQQTDGSTGGQQTTYQTTEGGTGGQQYQAIMFRKSTYDWDGKWSDAEQIGADAADLSKEHTELTSRPLQNGETFSITGSKQQIGAGLCIDSEGLEESNFALQYNYNCVGFYGDNTVMLAADESNNEYTVAMDRSASNIQGFTYDAENNCVTHVGSASKKCTSLPAHFGGKPVRAVGKVWNGAAAKLSDSSVELRSYVDGGYSVANYDYTMYYRYGMYRYGYGGYGSGGYGSGGYGSGGYGSGGYGSGGYGTNEFNTDGYGSEKYTTNTNTASLALNDAETINRETNSPTVSNAPSIALSNSPTLVSSTSPTSFPSAFPTWSDCVSMIESCQPWSEVFGSTSFDSNTTVVIPCEVCVTMEEFTNGELIDLPGGLDIHGQLHIPDGTSLTLRTKFIFVQGELMMRSTKTIDGNANIKVIMIGTEDCLFYPHPRNKVRMPWIEGHQQDHINAGKKAILVAGGQIDIRGFPEYSTTWENAIHVERENPPMALDFPRPQMENACISNYVTDQTILAKNRTWHTIFNIHPGSGCDVQADQIYVFKCKMRLVSKKPNNAKSACSARGELCAGVLLHRFNVNGTKVMERVASMAPSEAVKDGEWFDFEGKITLNSNQLQEFRDMVLHVPEPFVDIEVMHFEVASPPMEAYPNSTNVCGDLAINGDAERDGNPYPMQSFLNADKIVVKKELNGNSYFHMSNRKEWFSSLTFDLVTDCLLNNTMYYFSSRVWIHSEEPVRSAALLKVTNPDDTFFFKTLRVCGSSSEDIGWVECNAAVKIDDRFFGAKRVQFLLSPKDESTADIDMDDISFTFLKGTNQNILFDKNVTNAWAPGAEVLVTSQTFDFDDEQILQIETMDDVGHVKFTENFLAPASLEEERDYAGEYALLSRNIIFDIEHDDEEEPYHGGHIWIYRTPHCIGNEGSSFFRCDGYSHHIEGVEFRHFGQEGLKHRYPINIYSSFDSRDTTFRWNTFRETYQRCINIHSTSRILVEGNVAYNTTGTCYCIESRPAKNNEFIDNLGARTTKQVRREVGGWFERRFPATFGFADPTNTFIGNVAAGSEGVGFWFYNPWWDTSRLGLFVNNVAHSNTHNAIQVFPKGWDSPKYAIFKNIRVYRNRGIGWYCHLGEHFLIDGGIFADNRIGIDINYCDANIVDGAKLIGQSEAYDHLSATYGYKHHCWNDNYAVYGIRIHPNNKNTREEGSMLKDIDFSRYYTDIGCELNKAILMNGDRVIDDPNENHHIYNVTVDSKYVFLNIKYDKPIGLPIHENLMDFCPINISENYLNDMYIADSGGLNPEGTGPGFIIDDHPLMTKWSRKCVPLQDTCAVYCTGHGSCMTKVTIGVDIQETENVKLYISNYQNIIREVEGIAIHDYAQYESRRFYWFYLPTGNYVAQFKVGSSSNGSGGVHVWPTFAEIMIDHPYQPNCPNHQFKFHLQEPIPDARYCDNIAINGNVELGDIGSNRFFYGDRTWYFEKQNKTGLVITDGFNSPKAIQTNGRSHYEVGIWQFLDTRCMAEGKRYEIEARVKVENGCNPHTHREGNNRCVRASIRARNDGWDLDHDFAVAETLGPVEADGWNRLHGMFTISHALAECDNVAIFFEGPNADKDFAIDRYTVTPVNEQCNNLIWNHNFEVGDYRYWTWLGDDTGVQVVDKAKYNQTGFALTTMNREEYWHGISHDFKTVHCMQVGLQLEVQLEVRLEDVHGNARSCNAAQQHSGLDDTCPNLGIRIVHPNNEETYVEIGELLGPYKDESWNVMNGVFTVTQDMMEAKHLDLYINGPMAGVNIVIDNVIMQKVNPKTWGTVKCPADNLIMNGDAEWGNTRKWYIRGSTNMGELTLVGGARGSRYAFHHTGRTARYQGMKQLLDQDCMATGSQWYVHADFKLFDESGTAVTCNPTIRYSTDDVIACPLMLFESHTEGGSLVQDDFLLNEQPAHWDPNIWNYYEAIFTMTEQHKAYDTTWLFIHNVPPGYSYSVDNIGLRPVTQAVLDRLSPCDNLIFNPTFDHKKGTYDLHGWKTIGKDITLEYIDNEKYGGHGDSLAAKGRDNFYDGLAQEIRRRRCLKPGQQLAIRAEYRMENADGTPFECDPFVMYSGQDVSCPSAGLQLINQDDSLDNVKLGRAIGPYRENKWNVIWGQVDITKEMIDADHIELFFNSAPAGKTLVIENVWVKEAAIKLQKCPASLVVNGDAEAGDTRNWFIRGNGNMGKIDMVFGSRGTQWGFWHHGRTEHYHGMWQHLDQDCMAVGSEWKVSADIRLFDADGHPMSCDPKLRFSTKAAVACPVMMFQSHTEGGELYSDSILMSINTKEWEANHWNHYKAKFTMTEGHKQHDKTWFYVHNVPKDWSYFIDNIRIVKWQWFDSNEDGSQSHPHKAYEAPVVEQQKYESTSYVQPAVQEQTDETQTEQEESSTVQTEQEESSTVQTEQEESSTVTIFEEAVKEAENHIPEVTETYDYQNNDPLSFRYSTVDWDGKWSDPDQIGTIDKEKFNFHAELTNRPLYDGEEFSIVGNAHQVGIGLCIDSDDLESTYATRFNYNCVGFWGDDPWMRYADENGKEYKLRMDRPSASPFQGITYYANGNCVIHVKSKGKTCTKLPAHFEGKSVRALAQVWNGAAARLTTSNRELREYRASGSYRAIYNYSRFIRYGMYSMYGKYGMYRRYKKYGRYGSRSGRRSGRRARRTGRRGGNIIDERDILTFRISTVDWDTKWSDADQIGVESQGKTHAELTSRPLNDGETFSITANKRRVGVGLCIDSEDLESNYGLRWKHNCISFYGNATVMYAAKKDNIEYTVATDIAVSHVQGFKYDATNNCVTHIKSASKTCTLLPDHFAGKSVRAVGQVWSNTAAKISGSGVTLRHYISSGSYRAYYDYELYTRYGMYGMGYSVSQIQTMEQVHDLTFRYSTIDWDGKWSDADQIGIESGDWNKAHAELTSRSLQDGEIFSLTGSKQQIGAGLCIDSNYLESNYGLRWNYNCVGFYGDGTVMLAADANNEEYTVSMDRSPSHIQGFTYDASNNCVTHVGSANMTCTPLPIHFSGRAVRAIGQVWNGAKARFSGSSIALRSYASRGKTEADYDYSSYMKYGMYVMYDMGYSVSEGHSVYNNNTITFRESTVDWDGKWSDAEQIGIRSSDLTKSHTELTARLIRHGETFSIIGNRRHVGVGLCIDSEHLESNFALRRNYNCVGMYGTSTVMYATNENNTEYTIAMDRTVSHIQGFDYDAVNNCVTHIGSESRACTPLPAHFAGKHLRAVGQVWRNAIAKISDASVALRSYVSSVANEASYDYSSYIRHGMYVLYGNGFSVSQIKTVDKWQGLSFRYSTVDWDDMWSDSFQIGVQSGDKTKIHTELTSRLLLDGETFSLTGTKEQLAVGLCIDSNDLESNYGLRWNYNCVGFYGDVTVMYAANVNNTEYTVEMNRTSSNVQGFTYDADNNCVTHVGSADITCTPLPVHFAGKNLRAVGQVWNSTIAKFSESSVAYRSYISSQSKQASYEYSSYFRYGMYVKYEMGYSVSQDHSYHSSQSVAFRQSSIDWDDKWSDEYQIGIDSDDLNKTHVELTTRLLMDGETFSLIGTSQNLAVGLCIDSKDLESNFALRGNPNCVSFSGNTLVMWAYSWEERIEYTVEIDIEYSHFIGFEYNARWNCLTHIGSRSRKCIGLPGHFRGRAVRAVGGVWHKTVAKMSYSVVKYRRYTAYGFYEANYDNSCYFRYGMYGMYGMEYSVEKALTFRYSSFDWAGMWSDAYQIGIESDVWNRTHLELTSRTLRHGETFNITGSSQYLAVGLCIDSNNLEDNFSLRWNYDCVGFYGNMTVMYGSTIDLTEYTVAMNRIESHIQGFTFDGKNNCVTHVGSANMTCTPLPTHFSGRSLRAVGQVWNNTIAKFSESPVVYRSYDSTESFQVAYDYSSYLSYSMDYSLDRSLTFRYASIDWDSMWSDAEQIGVQSEVWNKTNTELTSRALFDGETFSITGNSLHLGVGLCIDSTDLESNFELRENYNCVGLYGDEKVMFASYQDNTEYTVEMDRTYSNTQGFTYDASNNCITHVGSANSTCTPLPNHFAGYQVRAVGQVWNNTAAKFTGSDVELRSYLSTEAFDANYDSMSYIKFGQQVMQYTTQQDFAAYNVRALTFRESDFDWNGKWSDAYQIGISSDQWNETHTELTSRALYDGQTFSVTGTSQSLGVGLCIDSDDLENNLRLQYNFNCVGFYGDETIMHAANEDHTEYAVAMDRNTSHIQGFKYDAKNNCVTHVGSANMICTSLPAHFMGASVRAVAQVWNNTAAHFSDVDVEIRSYEASNVTEAVYDYSTYIKRGMYAFYELGYSVGQNHSFYNVALEFRHSSVDWDGKWSDADQIGVEGSDQVHTEMTSRPLVDLEIFEITGSSQNIAVGLCVDSEDLKTNHALRSNYACVSMFGNENVMYSSDELGTEVKRRMDRSPSKTQGFTYDAVNNCVIHVGSRNEQCTRLPAHFKNKAVRAVAQVWNGAAAQLYGFYHPLRSYVASNSSEAIYDYSSWIGYGNYEMYYKEYYLSNYDSQHEDPITFRYSTVDWMSMWSDAYQIGVEGVNKTHTELTSRPMSDGETFSITGNKEQCGVGLCIDSYELEFDFGLREKHNCVGFYGDMTLMFAADENNTEYTVEMDRFTSNIQGFTYDEKNNCITYIGSANSTCTPLPDHFAGHAVRAIAEVWDGTTAKMSDSDVLLRLYKESGALEPSYDPLSYTKVEYFETSETVIEHTYTEFTFTQYFFEETTEESLTIESGENMQENYEEYYEQQEPTVTTFEEKGSFEMVSPEVTTYEESYSSSSTTSTSTSTSTSGGTTTFYTYSYST